MTISRSKKELHVPLRTTEVNLAPDNHAQHLAKARQALIFKKQIAVEDDISGLLNVMRDFDRTIRALFGPGTATSPSYDRASRMAGDAAWAAMQGDVKHAEELYKEAGQLFDTSL